MERETRNIGPHIAKVTFNIFVHKMMTDGSIHPVIVDCRDLFKDSQIAQKGELYIEGFDIWDCVSKVKQKLEKLGES
jgi:hypothetical protein